MSPNESAAHAKMAPKFRLKGKLTSHPYIIASRFDNEPWNLCCSYTSCIPQHKLVRLLFRTGELLSALLGFVLSSIAYRRQNMASHKLPSNTPYIKLDPAAEERFQSIWQNAVDSYKDSTDRDLLRLVQKRASRTHDIYDMFQDEEARFKKSREKYSKARGILQTCVRPIQVLSGVAEGALALSPYAPAAAIFGAGIFLLGGYAILSIQTSRVFQSFLKRRTRHWTHIKCLFNVESMSK